MPTKKGNKLHSKGNKLPFSSVACAAPSGYAHAIAVALRVEMERTGYGAKVVMRWTGASERTVKGWLGGYRGPGGEHLIALISQSDAVLTTVLRLAGRERTTPAIQLSEARRLLRDLMVALDKVGA